MAGDLDDNGFDDLVAGAPWERVGTLGQAGTLSVIPGSAGGLTSAGGFRVNQVGGTVEADDQFGAEVGTGDFYNDGVADLAAGAPAEDVGSAFNAGATSASGRLLHPEQPRGPRHRRGLRLLRRQLLQRRLTRRGTQAAGRTLEDTGPSGGRRRVTT